MQCSSCSCSNNREVVINSVKYLECDFCGNLMTPMDSVSYLNEELSKLRLKMLEVVELIENTKITDKNI